MTKGNLADPVHLKITEEPGDQSLLSFPYIILSSPPPDNIEPEKIPQSNLESHECRGCRRYNAGFGSV